MFTENWKGHALALWSSCCRHQRSAPRSLMHVQSCCFYLIKIITFHVDMRNYSRLVWPDRCGPELEKVAHAHWSGSLFPRVFTWYRCEILYRSKNSRPGTTAGVNSRRGDSRRHDILWRYHVNKCRAMGGNWSELAPARNSPRCHVNTP